MILLCAKSESLKARKLILIFFLHFNSPLKPLIGHGAQKMKVESAINDFDIFQLLCPIKVATSLWVLQDDVWEEEAGECAHI